MESKEHPTEQQSSKTASSKNRDIDNAHSAVDLEKKPSATDAPSDGYKLPKSRTRKQWQVILAVIILVAAIAAGVWYLVFIRNNLNVPSTDNQSANVESASQKAVIIPSEALSGQAITAKAVTSLGGQAEDGLIVFDFAAYQFEGSTYKVLPSSGTGKVAIKDAAGAVAAFAASSKAYTDNGFKQVSTSTADSGGLAIRADAPLVTYSVFANDTVVCSMANVDASKTSIANYIVSTGCADLSEYKSTASVAEPFVSAYSKKTSQNKTDQLIISSPDIKNGANKSQRAVIYQRDSTAPQNAGIHLYYRTSPDGEWQFLSSAGAKQITCGLITADEAKSAFKGVNCYDEKTRQITTI